ncbi:hypothetical protein ASPZODRAFT_59724, partial [Penicilliopsis zonata CBS 506.65]
LIVAHIIIHVPEHDKTVYHRTTSRLDQIMKPHLLDRGFDFEYHVSETDRRLWRINSLVPPPYKSVEEQVWVKENQAVPYEGAV